MTSFSLPPSLKMIVANGNQLGVESDRPITLVLGFNCGFRLAE